MKHYPSISDNHLYFQLRSGDQTALGLLYERYNEKLYMMIMRSLCYDSNKSQSLMQQVFKHAYDHIESYHPDQIRMFTWLLQIARNKIKADLQNEDKADGEQYHVNSALHPLPFFKMIVIDCKSVNSVSKNLNLEQTYIAKRLRAEMLDIRKHLQ